MDILRVDSFCMYDDSRRLFMGEEAGLLFFFNV